MNIGILALQGDFELHAKSITQLGYRPIFLRSANDFNQKLDGLILPGGESTTQLKLIDDLDLFNCLDNFVKSSKPVFATCAGLILAATKVINPAQKSFGWLNITVKRNAYGSQIESFESLSDTYKYPLVFIRAPQIIEVNSPTQILDTYQSQPIFVKQNNFFGATFHPELTSDLQIYQMIFNK